MDQKSLQQALSDLSLGEVRFFPRIDSTNDEAIRWCQAGAPDLALVAADEQTAGRGRHGRKWQTLPGQSLAFSLALYPPFGTHDSKAPDPLLARLSGLGGLAIAQALPRLYGLQAKIKWPNDVLLTGCKTAGILAEALWQGDLLQAVILGIGVNVRPASTLGLPDTGFPATCIETVLGRSIDRIELLHAILEELLNWRPRLGSKEFIQAWEARLAWRGDWVEVSPPPAGQATGQVLVQGLNEDGSLQVSNQSGQIINLYAGEIQIKPPEDSACSNQSR